MTTYALHPLLGQLAAEVHMPLLCAESTYVLGTTAHQQVLSSN